MNTPQKPADAAVANPRRVTRETRIPMSIPTLKMAVPAIDGFYQHWFAESNVARALEAGYERVLRGEQLVNGQATGGSIDGNTDLGSGVSIVGSLDGPSGGPERAILMKIRNEWRNEDTQLLEQKNAQIMEAIFGDEARISGKEGKTTELGAHQYRGKALLQRPTRKAKIVSGGRT